jgi:hypothetical protein
VDFGASSRPLVCVQATASEPRVSPCRKLAAHGRAKEKAEARAAQQRNEWAKRIERWPNSGPTTAELAAELRVNRTSPSGVIGRPELLRCYHPIAQPLVRPLLILSKPSGVVDRLLMLVE